MEEIDYEKMISPYGAKYKPMAKWKKVVDFTIDYIQKYKKYLDEHKILLTLRYLYYREIEEAGVLPISKNAYEGYIKVMAKARKDFDNTNWDIIRQYVSDDTRFDEKQYFFGWHKPTENKFIETIVKYLSLERRIYPFNTMVEVWFEDDGMFQMYKHIPNKYRLHAQCIRGNLIFETVRQACERLMDEERPIIILFVGDYNPSGNRRPVNVKTALADMGIEVDTYKVLVTKEQISEYNLLPDINKIDTKDRIKKAKRDPLIKWFVDKYGTEVYDVNAQAMDIELVDQLLTEAIESFVDPGVIDGLNEKIPIEHKIIKTDDGYKIKMDHLEIDEDR